MNAPSNRRWKHALEFSKEELHEARDAIQRLYDPRFVVEGYERGYLACIVDVWLDGVSESGPIHFRIECQRCAERGALSVGNLDCLPGDVALVSTDVDGQELSDDIAFTDFFLTHSDATEIGEGKASWKEKDSRQKAVFIVIGQCLENGKGVVITGVPSTPTAPGLNAFSSQVRLIQQSEPDDALLGGGEVWFDDSPSPTPVERNVVVGDGEGDQSLGTRIERGVSGSARDDDVPNDVIERRPDVADHVSDPQRDVVIEPLVIGKVLYPKDVVTGLRIEIRPERWSVARRVEVFPDISLQGFQVDFRPAHLFSGTSE